MKNGWFDWGMGAAAAVLMGTGLVVAGVNARPVEAAAAEFSSLIRAWWPPRSRAPMHRKPLKRNETRLGVCGTRRCRAYSIASARRARKQTAPCSLRASSPTCATFVPAMMSRRGSRRIRRTATVRLMGVSLRPKAETQVLISRGLDGTWTPHELKAKLSPGISYIVGRRRPVDLPDSDRSLAQPTSRSSITPTSSATTSTSSAKCRPATVSACSMKRSRTSAASR